MTSIFQTAMRGVDYMINTAALKRNACRKNIIPWNVSKLILMAVCNVIDAALENNVKKVVRSLYGPKRLIPSIYTGY
jgi:FlaA1/EpsC-like NDP-sugar epimerase